MVKCNKVKSDEVSGQSDVVTPPESYRKDQVEQEQKEVRYGDEYGKVDKERFCAFC